LTKGNINNELQILPIAVKIADFLKQWFELMDKMKDTGSHTNFLPCINKTEDGP
jgi:hypothetical protein